MPKHAEIEPRQQRVSLKGLLIGACFSITLAISLFAAGFALCTLPGTTATLSRLLSDFEHSVYLPAETTELAIATRNFTVEPYPQGEEAAATTLASRLLEAAQVSSDAQSLKAPQWRGVNIPKNGSALQRMYGLAAQGSQFALGEDEISHLIDCNKIIRIAIPVLIVIAIIALTTGVILGTSRGKRSVGIALIAAPTLLFVTMLTLSIWAVIDFGAFFAAFHALFFPQGNWTFPAESILICMLPTAFWIGMATLWAFTTIALALISIFIGRKLTRTYS